MIALALVRYTFRTRAATNILIFLPLSTPEIVLGASLLTLFLHFTFVTFGFSTILIAHVMFCISFAVVTVKARLIGFDRHLEEAAMDLGANEWTTFQKVTFPMIMPAILAAYLLCFAISVDDFVVTYFNAGSSVTFPIYVWGAARIGAPPQVNVIGTAIFMIAISAALANVLVQTRRAKAT
jgi:spermidine/putrescine transport system permease protein